MTPWPCSACGAPGAHNVGTSGFCASHYERLLDSFTPTTFVPYGRAARDGPDAPEYGPGCSYVHCRACEATWIGLIGERCPWCVRSYEQMLRWQAEMVLRPPEVDPEDVLYETRMQGWAKRLAVAVSAGIIDEGAARRVLERRAAA